MDTWCKITARDSLLESSATFNGRDVQFLHSTRDPWHIVMNMDQPGSMIIRQETFCFISIPIIKDPFTAKEKSIFS